MTATSSQVREQVGTSRPHLGKATAGWPRGAGLLLILMAPVLTPNFLFLGKYFTFCQAHNSPSSKAYTESPVCGRNGGAEWHIFGNKATGGEGAAEPCLPVCTFPSASSQGEGLCFMRGLVSSRKQSEMERRTEMKTSSLRSKFRMMKPST